MISGYQIEKKEPLLILLLFAIALFLRTAYFIDYKNTAAFPVLACSDGDFYYQRAMEISGGDIFTDQAFARWPFYAYFLAFLFKISATNVTLVYLLQFLLGALNAVFLYFIARRLFNEFTAFFAGLLYVSYGLFIFYEGLLIYTSLSLFLNLLLFLLILRLNDAARLKGLFWLGLLLGICTITQGNIILFGLPAIGWVLWRKSSGFAKLIFHFLVFGLGLGLILGVLLLRSYIIDKDLTLLTGNVGLNFYIGNNAKADGTLNCPGNINPTAYGMLRDARIIAQLNAGRQLSPSQVSRFWFNKAIDFIKGNPRDYFRLLFKKTAYLFSPRELIFEPEYVPILGKIRIFKIMFMDLNFILPFMFLGIFLNLKNFKKLILLYMAAITLAVSVILFFVQAKFRIMLVPFFMLFAASAIESLEDAIRNKKTVRFAILLLGVIIFFIFLKPSPRNMTPPDAPDNQTEFRYHFSKAIGYERISDYPAALAELNLASRIQPANHNIVYSLGVIYYGLGRVDEAEKMFKQAISLYPFFPKLIIIWDSCITKGIALMKPWRRLKKLYFWRERISLRILN